MYESWLVIEACQSAMSSDMSLLDAAANANHEIFDGVAQLETWMTTGTYSPSGRVLRRLEGIHSVQWRPCPRMIKRRARAISPLTGALGAKVLGKKE